MDTVEINELKERLMRSEQMNEASCRMLEQALDEIKRLNTTITHVRNQYEELLRSHAEQSMCSTVPEPQIDPNTGKYFQTRF